LAADADGRAKYPANRTSPDAIVTASLIGNARPVRPVPAVTSFGQPVGTERGELLGCQQLL
jgi:hypothetical protein